MKNRYNSIKNLNVQFEDHINEMIIKQLRHTGESLRSQHHTLEARLSLLDLHDEPKKYKMIKLLAQKVLELAEATIECADEYEFHDFLMYLEAEA